MRREQHQETYDKLVAKAWADEKFKARLLADPMTVIKESGQQIPAGVEIRILEDTGNMVHFILPQEKSDELNDDELEMVSGGGGNSFGKDSNTGI